MRPPLPLLLIGGGLTAVLFSTSHPAVLAGGAIASLALLLAAPGSSRGPILLALLLAVPVALLNPFVAVEGDLVLIPGPSFTVIDFEVTLEELLYGAAIGARLFAVTLLTTAVLRLVDADRLQARASRLAPRSALTVALAARLVPVLRGDARRLAEAARLRGVAPTGRGAGALLVPLAATSLERGLDQAEAMSARGYGTGRRSALPERALQAREWAAAALGAATIPLAAALLAGRLPYAYYPHADPVLAAAALVTGAFLALVGIGAAALLRPKAAS
jgi:energy-coupling factor transport system permease protein